MKWVTFISLTIILIAIVLLTADTEGATPIRLIMAFAFGLFCGVIGNILNRLNELEG